MKIAVTIIAIITMIVATMKKRKFPRKNVSLDKDWHYAYDEYK